MDKVSPPENPPLFQGLEPTPDKDYTYKWTEKEKLPATGPEAKAPPGSIALWQEGRMVGLWPEKDTESCAILRDEDGNVYAVYWPDRPLAPDEIEIKAPSEAIHCTALLREDGSVVEFWRNESVTHPGEPGLSPVEPQ